MDIRVRGNFVFFEIWFARCILPRENDMKMMFNAYHVLRSFRSKKTVSRMVAYELVHRFLEFPLNVMSQIVHSGIIQYTNKTVLSSFEHSDEENAH